MKDKMLICPNVKVRKIPVFGAKIYAEGVEASWENGHWVAIICSSGMIGCSAFNAEFLEEHHQAIAIAQSSNEKLIITCEDLLNAKIIKVTNKAREFGIKVGMTGYEAIKLLS